MSDSPAKIKTRVRDAVAAATQGFDAAVTAVESALLDAWRLERRGVLGPREVPDLLDALESALRKLAPPPPKKVKFSDPLRRILPLPEPSVAPAFDAAVLLMALAQVGDFTETSDKKQVARLLFLDDWRRMIWESARVTVWARFRSLVPREERVVDGRLSRDSALRILEALQKRRADNLTPVPDLSILACDRCGSFKGSDRGRCGDCRRTFCTKCLSPVADRCLVCYSGKYQAIEPGRREKLASDARAVLKEFRLDPHSRNDAFARALRERGVDVAFLDAAPLEGRETEASQGRFRLEVRDRDAASTRRVLFGAFARAAGRSAGEALEPLQAEFFVDLCMGLPVDDALRSPAPKA
jgi:hypothetical protein